MIEQVGRENNNGSNREREYVGYRVQPVTTEGRFREFNGGGIVYDDGVEVDEGGRIVFGVNYDDDYNDDFEVDLEKIRKDKLARHRLRYKNKGLVSKSARKNNKNYENYDKEEEAQCCICLESLLEKRENQMLECGHVFHKQCIGGWVEEGKGCPICRL